MGRVAILNREIDMANAEERFIAVTITRKFIAGELNRVIKNEQMDIPSFSAGDDRLTSELCTKIADQSYPSDWGDPSADWYWETELKDVLEEMIATPA